MNLILQEEPKKCFKLFSFKNNKIIEGLKVSKRLFFYSVIFTIISGLTSFEASAADPIRILVIGETGSGKTTLIQSIFNTLKRWDYADLKFICKCNRPQTKLSYPVDDDRHCPHKLADSEDFEKTIVKQIHPDGNILNQSKSQTGAVVRYNFSSEDNKIYEIIDTPGFSANSDLDGNLDKEISETIESLLAEEKINYVVLTMNGSIERGASVNRCIVEFNRFFGDIDREDLERHTVIIGTHRENDEDTVEAWKSSVQKMQILEDISRAAVTCVDSKYLFYPKFNLDEEDFEYEQRMHEKRFRKIQANLLSILSHSTTNICSEQFIKRQENRKREHQLRCNNQQRLSNLLESYEAKSNELSGIQTSLEADKTLKDLKIAEKEQKVKEKNLAEEQVDKQCTHRYARLKIKCDHFQEKVPIEYKQVMKKCETCAGEGGFDQPSKKFVLCPKRGGHDIWHRCSKCGHRGSGDGLMVAIDCKRYRKCTECDGQKEVSTGDLEATAYKCIYAEREHSDFPSNPNGHRHIFPNGLVKLISNICLADCPDSQDGIREEELDSYLHCNSEGQISGNWSYMLDKNGDNCSYCNEPIKPNSTKLEFSIFNEQVIHRLVNDPQLAENLENMILGLDNEINQLTEETEDKERRVNLLQVELQELRGSISDRISFYSQQSEDGSERPLWEKVVSRDHLQVILNENLQIVDNNENGN